jgi:hypothetical protein
MMKKMVVVLGLCALIVNRQNASKDSVVMSRENQETHAALHAYVTYYCSVRNQYVKEYQAGQYSTPAQKDVLKQTITIYDKQMAEIIQLTKRDGFEDIVGLSAALRVGYTDDAIELPKAIAIALKQK